MLLNFEVKNYKSFLENAEFSMVPAPKQHGLDYSILTDKVKSKKVKGLCSSVIYGPNASGKTNIIGAMDTFRAIVLRGNIRNAEDQNTPNKAAYNLELIPNNVSDEVQPVVFKIEFVENGMKFRYELSVLLGLFLDDTYIRSVEHTHNPIFLNSNIFRRDEIKFVEKDDDTMLSEIYALSDFGTTGENGVRKGDDYMKNYFVSQYGAIKTIDFSPLFEDVMAAVSDNC